MCMCACMPCCMYGGQRMAWSDQFSFPRDLTQVVSPGRGRKCFYLLNHPMVGLELLTKINALSLLSQVLGLVSEVLWSAIDFL